MAADLKPTAAEQLAAAQEREALSGALLAATSFILQGSDATDIVLRLGDALIQATPRIRRAWFWIGDAKTDEIRPPWSVGPARAVAERIAIRRDHLVARGPLYALPLPNDPGELRAAVAVPVAIPEGRDRGLLAFYADEAGYFDRVGPTPFKALARFAEVALEQANLKAQLQKLATSDALTGLLTRRAMHYLLSNEIESCMENGGEVAVMLLDIDHFKKVNDTRGHEAGDVAIRAVADTLRAQLRNADRAGRWGGEEFLLMVADADRDVAGAVAERVRRAVQRAVVAAGGSKFGVTVSIGVAQYPADGQGVQELVQVADQRLYRAKQAGRNRVVAE